MSGAGEYSAWRHLYRLALRTLPAALRRKHGEAMAALFLRELHGADGRGDRARIALSAVGDVLRRAPYEWVHGAADTPDAADDTMTLPPMRVRNVAAQLLVPFAASFVMSTGIMIALYLQRSRFDVSPVEQFVLSLPYMCVLTVPLALCIAVAWVARHTRRGVGSLRMPPGLQRAVLIVSAGVAAFTLLLGAEIVPRANARLVAIRYGNANSQSDRTMTLVELRRATERLQRRAQASPATYSAHAARVQVAELQVEYHKKLVLAASCIVLAFVGLALGWYLAHANAAVVLLASSGGFVLFVLSLMAGESLADSLATSPALAMWAGTELLFAAALVSAATQRMAAKHAR
jgi:lipopolysaccharide export LptBFGC system permease protein LptF